MSIDDIRLVYLYNIGFICIIGSLFSSIFLEMTYLETDNLHGITEARIKTPANWSPNSSDSFCEEHLCVKWDAFEVGYSYTSDSLFIATRVIDSLENSTCNQEQKANFRLLGNTNDEEVDTVEQAEEGDEVIECAEYKRVSKKQYYPYGVEDFHLMLGASAEALEFCSSSNFQPSPGDKDSSLGCPYIYTLRDTPGELLSYNGTVMRIFDPSHKLGRSLREVPVSSYLAAAGVSSLSDWKLRDRGGVFLISLQFQRDHTKLGYLTGLLTNPEREKLPTKFSIHVKRLAQAGYKVS